MIQVRPLSLSGLYEIRPPRYGDDRGFFSEVWSKRSLADAGIDLDFVQDNHSWSARRGVLRGLHLQRPPAAQDKLVRVIRGSIFDVAVDVRRSSPTFGTWEAVVLSSEEWNQLLIPRGFAHGFVTLSDDTEVAYKVTAPYDRDCERSIRYDDPLIGINWPQLDVAFTLSEKDQNASSLAQVDLGFS